MLAWPYKDPDSHLRYWFDWTDFIAGEESDIDTYALSIDDPPDSSLVIGANAIDGAVVMVWLSGGTVGSCYNVRCRVTLFDGTIEDESRSLAIRER